MIIDALPVIVQIGVVAVVIAAFVGLILKALHR
jgi:hypothetical protein